MRPIIEQISLTLKKAKISRQRITITTDDEKKYTGIIQELDRWTLTLRLPDGIMYIPLVEIEDVRAAESDDHQLDKKDEDTPKGTLG
ncbi:hypothetical protein PaecuDRAFT_3571 [Paenibacillus curdlanolyticus YK9]|uniref:Uncharacterized protein n=1 Tax=Paenibacillus curdlanolyticus YK9 TaxID=717606 RepID=E0ID69_9BACL|nr:hypothetical protein PaecuDRAFT_3571 [Paenibacillus curdlanolyticus YK9]